MLSRKGDGRVSHMDELLWRAAIAGFEQSAAARYEEQGAAARCEEQSAAARCAEHTSVL